LYWLLNNKNNLIIKRIPLVIPLNSETLSSYLTPLLAQYNIKYLDFLTVLIRDFGTFAMNVFPNIFAAASVINTKKLSDYDLIIRVTLILYNTGKYVLEIQKPTISFMLSYFYKRQQKKIKKWKKKTIVYQLYKLTYLLSFIIGNEETLNKQELQTIYKNLLHYLYRSGGKQWLALGIEKLKKKKKAFCKFTWIFF